MDICGISEIVIDNIKPKCGTAKGYESEAVFVRYEDIDRASIVYDDENGLIVTNLEPKTGAHGATVVQLKNAFSGTNTEFNEGDYRNTVNSNVVFSIYTVTPSDALNAQKLLNGKYVVLLRQNEVGIYVETTGGTIDKEASNTPVAGGAKYRIFGLQNGCVCTALSNDAYDESIGNGFNITLTENNADSVANFLIAKVQGKFDMEATEQMVETLIQGK